jgi:hypothetical protein
MLAIRPLRAGSASSSPIRPTVSGNVSVAAGPVQALKYRDGNRRITTGRVRLATLSMSPPHRLDETLSAGRGSSPSGCRRRDGRKSKWTAQAWHCTNGRGGTSEGWPARMQPWAQPRTATIVVIQMSP